MPNSDVIIIGFSEEIFNKFLPPNHAINETHRSGEKAM